VTWGRSEQHIRHVETHLDFANEQRVCFLPLAFYHVRLHGPEIKFPSTLVKCSGQLERSSEARRIQLPSKVLAPFPCREDLALVAEKHYKLNGRMAEVGVFRGNFAEYNLQFWTGEYYLIDAWSFRKPAEDAANLARVQQRLRRFNTSIPGQNVGRVHEVCALSISAAELFPDNFFDVVYIDANKSHEAVLEDMEAYWSKVRPGGLLAGDDYGDYRDTENLMSARYSRMYGPDARKYGWGVIGAVQAFARGNFKRKPVQYHVTWGKPSGDMKFARVYPNLGSQHFCFEYPAWWMLKPK